MSRANLNLIINKSLDVFLDKEWKTDLLFYLAVIIFTIGVMMLILSLTKSF